MAVGRRAKIICTVGPSLEDDERLLALLELGVDAFRLNLGYGRPEEHETWVARIRALSRRAGRSVAIIADLPGAKIRLGAIEGGTVELTRGQPLRLVRKSERPGNASEIPIDASIFGAELVRGDKVLLSDGLVELIVTRFEADSIETEVAQGGAVTARGDVHLPGVPLRQRALTAADRTFVDASVKAGVDFLALTYVRDASDILEVREHLERLGRHVPIIAKIDRAEAFARLDGILERADAVMIRRGDLGADIELTRIPLVQKEVVSLANLRGVPVIIGTQMLNSMLSAPRPTRAEASDVSNAIADGADGVVLNAETAIGQYPVESFQMMVRIIQETERETFERKRQPALVSYPSPFPDTAARIACTAAADCEARLIACFTESGHTAGLVAKYRPRVPIVAFGHTEETRRSLAIRWGVDFEVLDPILDLEKMVEQVDKKLLGSGRAQKGDRIVIVFGAPVGEMGHTNSVRLHEIGSRD